MDVKQAIESRRSIRRFKPDALPHETIEMILDAARLAPSGKNEQPWQFVVVQGDEREKMSKALQAGLQSMKVIEGIPTGSAEYTFRIMKKRPRSSSCLTPRCRPWDEQDGHRAASSASSIRQSIGGAIENMLLRAQELCGRFAVDLRYVRRL